MKVVSYGACARCGQPVMAGEAEWEARPGGWTDDETNWRYCDGKPVRHSDVDYCIDALKNRVKTLEGAVDWSLYRGAQGEKGGQDDLIRNVLFRLGEVRKAQLMATYDVDDLIDRIEKVERMLKLAGEAMRGEDEDW